MVAGINNVLRNNGYSMFLNTTENIINNEVKIVREVIENCMAGVILIGLPLDFVNNEHIVSLKNKKIPVVLAYREFKPTIFPVVFPDFFNGGKTAIEYLLKQGTKKDWNYYRGAGTSYNLLLF
jgi:DNA-binding LacI/PurR family transcriptional regulator